jgi:hypothetical protein
MTQRRQAPRLADMIEAIERARHVMGNLDLQGFEADWENAAVASRTIDILFRQRRTPFRFRFMMDARRDNAGNQTAGRDHQQAAIEAACRVLRKAQNERPGKTRDIGN